MRKLSAKLRLVGTAALLCILLISASHRPVQAAADTVDEIHISYGNDAASQMWIYWHGAENQIYYGLDNYYGASTTAASSPITPIDITGAFHQVLLSGLSPDTTYHYRIGAGGIDHSFQTAPSGDFTWDDIGDTGSSFYDPGADDVCNKTWVPSTWQQIAAEQPAVVTHGGDISYQNECGIPAIHQFFNDIAPVAISTPIEFSWGNHEYGPKTSDAPANTLARDSMANYKGRYNMPNAQTMLADNTKRVSPPGCPSPSNAKVNGCQGDDWGSFVAGHALFISYPEPWGAAYSDWKTQADALMATAEADPAIYFIITYGHRPAYSANAANTDPDLQAAVNYLGDKYSPSARPDGKYVLNIGHHVHQGEAFAPQHGVVSLVNGAGGSEQLNLITPVANELWTNNHFSHLNVKFVGNQLTYNFICGPVFALKPTKAAACDQGSVLFGQTISGFRAGPAVPVLKTTLTNGTSTAEVGDTLRYTLQVSNIMPGTMSSGVAPSLTLPANMTITDPGQGQINNNTISWQPSDLAAGNSVTETVAATLNSGNPGDSIDAQANVTAADTSCDNAGSVCSASDSDTIPSPVTEWVTNQSFEADLTGWAKYSASGTLARTTSAAFDGTASARITRSSTNTANPGIKATNHWVSSSVAGKTYDASVYVHPGTTGQSMTLQIKEVASNGTIVAAKNFKLNATNTNWQKISGSLVAAGSGHEIYLNVFSTNLPIGAWFDVDFFSLTSQN